MVSEAGTAPGQEGSSLGGPERGRWSWNRGAECAHLSGAPLRGLEMVPGREVLRAPWAADRPRVLAAMEGSGSGDSAAVREDGGRGTGGGGQEEGAWPCHGRAFHSCSDAEAPGVPSRLPAPWALGAVHIVGGNRLLKASTAHRGHRVPGCKDVLVTAFHWRPSHGSNRTTSDYVSFLSS